MRMNSDLINRFRKNKIRVALAVALFSVIVLLFPVQKERTVNYYDKDGKKAASSKEKTYAPWWLPESALIVEKPLSEASKRELEEIGKQAKGTNDTEKKNSEEKAVLNENEKQPGSGGDQAVEPGGSPSGSGQLNEGEPGMSPGSSTGSGATIESRIPASVEGYSLFTEQRSILSWLGVFKSNVDANIKSLDIVIELRGKNKALEEMEKFRQQCGGEVKEVRVEGLKGYGAVISPGELKLVFADGDFYYELQLLTEKNAGGYLDALVKTAADSRL